jgi:NAD(P)-dependent dehydrogenase (short-subunit alcohol dehydrogenase family)
MGITVDQLVGAIPLRRIGTAQEMAEMIAFLVSERASYVTGHDHFVTGGFGDLV